MYNHRYQFNFDIESSAITVKNKHVPLKTTRSIECKDGYLFTNATEYTKHWVVHDPSLLQLPTTVKTTSFGSSVDNLSVVIQDNTSRSMEIWLICGTEAPGSAVKSRREQIIEGIPVHTSFTCSVQFSKSSLSYRICTVFFVFVSNSILMSLLWHILIYHECMRCKWGLQGML